MGTVWTTLGQIRVRHEVVLSWDKCVQSLSLGPIMVDCILLFCTMTENTKYEIPFLRCVAAIVFTGAIRLVIYCTVFQAINN